MSLTAISVTGPIANATGGFMHAQLTATGRKAGSGVLPGAEVGPIISAAISGVGAYDLPLFGTDDLLPSGLAWRIWGDITTSTGAYWRLSPQTYQLPASLAPSVALDALTPAETATAYTTYIVNPLTTLGDLLRAGIGGVAQRLGIGTPGQVLTVVGGVPAWANPASGTSLGNSIPPADAGSGAVGTATDAAHTDHQHPLSSAYATAGALTSETAARAAGDALLIPLTQRAAVNGVATLDGSGKVPTGQLPALAITDTFVVASQAAMLALTAQTGDVAVRSDLNKSYILAGSDPTILANWQELLTPTDAVLSVNTLTGAVTLDDSNINAQDPATGGTVRTLRATLSNIYNAIATAVAAYLPLAGGTLTGLLTISSTGGDGLRATAGVGSVGVRGRADQGYGVYGQELSGLGIDYAAAVLGASTRAIPIWALLGPSGYTTTEGRVLLIEHDSSGAIGAGFGAAAEYRLRSSTTSSRIAGRSGVRWTTATDASRAAVWFARVNTPGSNTLVDTLVADLGAGAGTTGLWLYDADAGTLVRVTKGAADSGGTGYALLRVPN